MTDAEGSAATSAWSRGPVGVPGLSSTVAARLCGASLIALVEAQAFPVDPAQAGDPRGAFDPEDAEGQHVAHLQPGGLGEIGIDRNQRLAAVERSPPLTLGQFVAFGQVIGIGQPALAA
jgi:hypothetical protein